MKKNLFIAALAFVAMGANAQVVNTLDGYQAGAQFVQDGITYEVVEVSPATVKVVGAAETSVIVQEQFSLNDTYTVVDFSAGLAQLDLEEVTAASAEPLTIEDAFFTDATYEEGKLICPEASITKYAKAAGWKNFLLKYTDKGDLLGDVDGNKKLTNNDVVGLLDIILEGDEDLYNPLYDLDGNGKLTNNDLIKLLDLVLADLF